MYIFISSGKRENRLWETGMDIFEKEVGDVSDEDSFANNNGKGRQFPGGTAFTYQGKEVSRFTRWITKGSITSTIQFDILASLDLLNIFDRITGDTPLLLVTAVDLSCLSCCISTVILTRGLSVSGSRTVWICGKSEIRLSKAGVLTWR